MWANYTKKNHDSVNPALLCNGSGLKICFYNRHFDSSRTRPCQILFKNPIHSYTFVNQVELSTDKEVVSCILYITYLILYFVYVHFETLMTICYGHSFSFNLSDLTPLCKDLLRQNTKQSHMQQLHWESCIVVGHLSTLWPSINSFTQNRPDSGPQQDVKRGETLQKLHSLSLTCSFAHSK